MTDEATTQERTVIVIGTLRSILEAAEASPMYADSLARTLPLTQMRMLLQPGEMELTFRVTDESLFAVDPDKGVFDDCRWSTQEPPQIGIVLANLVDWLGFLAERAPGYLGGLDHLERMLQPALGMITQEPVPQDAVEQAQALIDALDDDDAEDSGVHAPFRMTDAMIAAARVKDVRRNFQHLDAAMLRELAAEALVLAERKGGDDGETH